MKGLVACFQFTIYSSQVNSEINFYYAVYSLSVNLSLSYLNKCGFSWQRHNFTRLFFSPHLKYVILFNVCSYCRHWSLHIKVASHVCLTRYERTPTQGGKPYRHLVQRGGSTLPNTRQWWQWPVSYLCFKYCSEFWPCGP